LTRALENLAAPVVSTVGSTLVEHFDSRVHSSLSMV